MRDKSITALLQCGWIRLKRWCYPGNPAGLSKVLLGGCFSTKYRECRHQQAQFADTVLRSQNFCQ